MTKSLLPSVQGKLECFRKTIKEQSIRPQTPLSLEDAKRIGRDFIE